MSGIDDKTVAVVHYNSTVEQCAVIGSPNFSVTSPISVEVSDDQHLPDGTSSLHTHGSGYVLFPDFTLDTTKDFTIAWYEKLIGANNSQSSIEFNCSGSIGVAGGGIMPAHHYNGNRMLFASNTTSAWNLLNSVVLCSIASIVNRWVHWEIDYVDTTKTIYVFKDGKLIYSTALSARIGNINYGNAALGGHPGINGAVDAYFDNVVVLQRALHVADFTPARVPLTDVDLKLGFNPPATGSFVDEVGCKWAVCGLPKPPSTTAKFDGGSLDTAVNYLTASSPALAFGVDDFTVDLWLYCRTPSAYQSLYTNTDQYTSGGSLRISTGGDGLRLQVGAGSSPLINSSVALTVGTWTHVALVRLGTRLALYQDGVNVGEYTLQPTSAFTFPGAIVGVLQPPTAYGFVGCVDEFRVSKCARWATNFKPPTAHYARVFFLGRRADGAFVNVVDSAVVDLGKPSSVAETVALFTATNRCSPFSASELVLIGSNSTTVAYQPTAPTDLTVTAHATPRRQFVSTNEPIALNGMSYVDWVHVNDGVVGETGGGSLRLTASYDGGRTWLTYANGAWSTILNAADPATGVLNGQTFTPTEAGVQAVVDHGMTVATFNAAPWQAVTLDVGYKSMLVAVVLAQDAVTDVALVDTLKLQYDGVGRWELGANKVDYKVWSMNSSHTLTWLTPAGGKRVKVNY